MKLSIITINLNNAEGLRKTIESVISQTFTDLEYIVIDGASTDGSLDIIKQYAGRINYWISEADTGIYNAMNKGIKVAKGEYVLFLNSGDWFVDQDVLCDFSSINCNSDIITGNLIILDDSGTTQLHIAPDQEQLSFNTFTRGSLPHQASFIKRTLFDKYGLYDETYKIVSDKDFFIKALIVNNCSYEHIDRVISCFPLGWS
jgi:Glycosyltransferases involved in cell wall biogenesis